MNLSDLTAQRTTLGLPRLLSSPPNNSLLDISEYLNENRGESTVVKPCLVDSLCSQPLDCFRLLLYFLILFVYFVSVECLYGGKVLNQFTGYLIF